MDISIVVPAYNEEKRLPKFLKDLLDFSAKLENCEIIMVNDGSVDNTLSVMKDAKKNDNNGTALEIITYDKNRGKGHAVMHGVMASKGKKIIFIDADGSINPNHIPRMLEKLDEYDIVVGDRNSKNSKVEKIPLRKITSILFNTYVSILFNTKIRDNLCGFKGFNKNVGKTLFNNIIEERWIFDVELFYKIRKKKYKIYDMPFEWVHMNGSKMKATDPIKMIYELIGLRLKLFLANVDENNGY